MGDPVLYGLSRSVYTRIARLALEEKGVRYSLAEVEIFGPDGVPAEHRVRQPFGRIPAFAHDGFTLYETGAIVRYVDEAFAGTRLQPQDPRARARMNQVIGIVDSYCYRPMIWGVFFARIVAPTEGFQADEGHLAETLAKSRACCRALEDILGSKRYFTGDELTLADLHALPILLYFSMAREGVETLAAHTRLLAWLESLAARPSVQRTKGKYELDR
ncbi:MAG TPA: glutathione S-transferase family protein [Steroidobacteraceae bacterium]|nr:glutathione S-transferase family protein [Steroidobacteraceae bacterium]